MMITWEGGSVTQPYDLSPVFLKILLLSFFLAVLGLSVAHRRLVAAHGFFSGCSEQRRPLVRGAQVSGFSRPETRALGHTQASVVVSSQA